MRDRLPIGVVMLVTAALGCAATESTPVDAGASDAVSVPADSAAIRPFTIDVPDAVLVDL